MRTTIKAVMIVGALLTVTRVIRADPFLNPPEQTHPRWQTPYPYQRNIMVGFDTDPHFWPDHITSPTPDDRKALTPSVVVHQGVDDAQLYASDWMSGNVDPPNGGFTAWLDNDTETDTNRQGILVLNGQAGTTFTLTWHIDNWDRPWAEKHFFAEAEFYTTANIGMDQVISSSGQVEPLVGNYEDLGGGWSRWHSWTTLAPNPVWEEMVNTITFEQPGLLLLDFMHVATECVPEPPAITMLGASACILLVVRGRTRS